MRYERQRPGELLHLDTKKLGRFRKAGHRVGARGPLYRNYQVGWEFLHVCVDDHSRLAYVEMLGDERAITSIAFVRRAVRWLRQHGVRAERVMTDNGSGYRSGHFASACRELGLRHLRTQPYTPRTNGKAERFIQTLLREWAYAAVSDLESASQAARTLAALLQPTATSLGAERSSPSEQNPEVPVTNAPGLNI